MQKLELSFFDDLDWTEARERVPADETVYLAIDGTEVELDLSTGHAVELRDSLARYMKAGRPTRERETGAGGKIIEARKIGRATRDFSDENIAEHPTWTYSKRGHGSYYYSRDLLRAFTEHAAAATAAPPRSPVS